MEFKGIRAKLYGNLDWAKETSFIDTIIAAGRFKITDKVLDVGTGTGIMAHAISPLVDTVVGLDISRDMLALNQPTGNIETVMGDIRKPEFESGSFDKIVARQVFHHIINGTQKAIAECHRLLRDGGLMILAEGVPPTLEAKPHYEKVFAIKEKRIVFMDNDLVNLLKAGGFGDVESIVIWQRRMSIRNWLVNSNLSKDKQERIFQLYPQYEDVCRRAYNMTIADGDCFIDMKQVIVVGRK